MSFWCVSFPLLLLSLTGVQVGKTPKRGTIKLFSYNLPGFVDNIKLAVLCVSGSLSVTVCLFPPPPPVADQSARG